MMWVAPIGLNCQCHRIELILTTKQSDQYREFADSGRVRSAGCAASQITFPGRQRLCYRLLLFPVTPPVDRHRLDGSVLSDPCLLDSAYSDGAASGGAYTR